MSPSGASPISLPVYDVEPDLYSLDGSDSTQSDELPDTDDDFDAPDGQTRSLPTFECDAADVVDSRSVDILHNTDITVGILHDPWVLRFNCVRDGLFEINPTT
jgi:hypothetical protein